MAKIGDFLDATQRYSIINPEITETAAKIAGAALGAGFQGWGTFVGREILFQPGLAAYMTANECFAKSKENLVVTAVKWSGDRNGQVYIVVPESAVKGVVALFLAVAMGSEPDFEGTKLDNEGMDAYSELANTMVQQGAQKLRGDIGGKIEWQVENNKVIASDNGGPAETMGNNEYLCASGQLTIQGLGPVTVHMLMSVPCTGMTLELPASQSEEAAEQAGDAQADALPKPRKHRNEGLAMSIRLPLIVVLASNKKRVESIKELAPGSIIEFRKLNGEFLDINAGNTKIAEGEVVIVNQHFGIQIRRITPQIPYASMLRRG